MQVPDLIDLALLLLFGGWHILQTSEQASIQENSSHCLYNQRLTCVVKQRLLRELCPLASCPRFPFFGLLLVRPENVLRGSPHFTFFGSFCGKVSRAGIRGPEKGWRKQIWAIQDRKSEAPKMIGTNWACAILFFPALPERICWLRGLDCHAISPLQQLAD